MERPCSLPHWDFHLVSPHQQIKHQGSSCSSWCHPSIWCILCVLWTSFERLLSSLPPLQFLTEDLVLVAQRSFIGSLLHPQEKLLIDDNLPFLGSSSRKFGSKFFHNIGTIWKKRNDWCSKSCFSSLENLHDLSLFRLRGWIKGWGDPFPYKSNDMLWNPYCLKWQKLAIAQKSCRNSLHNTLFGFVLDQISSSGTLMHL